jgi:Mlc titration factor MtfA (ptsG expression regulator)
MTIQVFLFLAVLVAYIFFKFFRSGKKILKPMTDLRFESLTEIFSGRFKFYDNLSEDDRKKFLFRVNSFLEKKRFLSRAGLEITEEMKAMVAGAAIQLSFGLQNFTFDYFNTIILFPHSYYSKMTGKRHVGEANPIGAIVVSWEDFQKGFKIPDDTYNVGLHEMAHALELENRLGDDVEPQFDKHFSQFTKISSSEFNKLQNDEDSFLRSYGGTNRQEFFAVCIEHFFERSVEFKKSLPDIYESLRVLLNQDPAVNQLQVEN